MKSSCILLVFAMLMLTGCISQTYYQKVNSDGSSVIGQTTDYSAMLAKAGEYGISSKDALENAGAVFGNICKKTKMNCSYSEVTITLKDNIAQKNPYYTFDREYGLLGTRYEMVIGKIPRQQFETALQNGQDVLSKDIPLTFQKQVVPDLDLSRKKENAAIARSIVDNGASAKYIVEFPAGIKSARAGNYTANVDGNKAEFDLALLLKESAPIVIEGEEFSIAMPIAIILVVLLVYVFFKFSKAKRIGLVAKAPAIKTINRKTFLDRYK